MLDTKLMSVVERMQKNEITGFNAYTMLAKKAKDEHNRKVLLRMAGEEKKHYETWKKYTQKDIKPNSFVLFIYSIFNTVFGFTFTLKFMEKLEDADAANYEQYIKELPEAQRISEEEEEHEKELNEILSQVTPIEDLSTKQEAKREKEYESDKAVETMADKIFKLWGV